MIVLGIETSCDETAAAVVRDGRETLSNAVRSQAASHAPYGGVVPDIAARQHVDALAPVIGQAMREAGLAWDRLDAVAATCGPGLSSSLLIGLAAGQALARRLGRPLYAVNHVEAHLYSPFLAAGRSAFERACPCVALIVSGGHTLLALAEAPGRYRLLGQTLDDAAGEALDKAAIALGLGYPGGPAIEQASQGGDPRRIAFPRARPRRPNPFLGTMDPDFCFSFSGLKTALIYWLKAHPFADGADRRERLPSVAASFQEAIVAALCDRCQRAVRKTGVATLIAGGGVTLNARLREALAALARNNNVELRLAAPAFCGDNAAMIAALAGIGLGQPVAGACDANPSLALGAA